MNTSELAEYYTNIPITDKNIRSVVHLEDESDEYFWNTLLQKYRPGNYFYVSHSKKGKTPGGCKECLKFKEFLSDRFFICIDSDLKYLSKEKDINAQNFILQTYTYSWENHFCHAGKIQQSIQEKFPSIAQRFNFESFLSELSSAIFEDFLHFLIMNRRGFRDYSINKFMQILPQTYSENDMKENGRNFISKIRNERATYVDCLEINHYMQMGVDEKNVYLHIKGHYLYNLVKFIGKQLFRKENINFEKDILLTNLHTSGYWQMDKIRNDIRQL